jgi:hypothetical protein
VLKWPLVRVAEHDREEPGALGLIERSKERVLCVDRGDVRHAELREQLLVVEHTDVLDGWRNSDEIALAHRLAVGRELVDHERVRGERVVPAEFRRVVVEIHEEPGLPQGPVDRPAFVTLHDVGRIVAGHLEFDGGDG